MSQFDSRAGAQDMEYARLTLSMQDESLLGETQYQDLCPSVSPSSLLVVLADTLPH